MANEPIVLSVFLINQECMISPLEIQDKTIRTPEWSYFQSILNDVFELIKPFPWITLNAKPSSINATKHIHILLADPQLNLSNPMVLQNIAGQTSLRWVSENHPMAPTLPNKKPAPYYSPIISIGYEDIMSTYSLPRESEEKDPEKRRIRSYDMDSRFKFLDSSIWHRYVPVYSGGHYVFKQRFREVILEIVQNHSDELYRTNAARAMLEFQLRMMRESYIFPVGERNHSKMVTPFKFHSETQMKEKADQLMEKYFIANGINKALRWRFLLVDDYANTGISADGNDNIQLSKKALVEKLLKGLKIEEIDFPIDSYGNSGNSASKDIIKKCLDKLAAPRRYDILLLDYLLAGISGKEEEREYGFEFLQLLQQDRESKTPKYKRGPFMRHWIFPISSFPFALYDKLRQLGIDNYHELWHLSGGGDPIATPHLFRYYFLGFLKLQIEEVLLTDKALCQHISTYFYEVDPETWADTIAKWLDNILSKIKVAETIKKESIFAESILNILFDEYKFFIAQAREVLYRAKAERNSRNYSIFKEALSELKDYSQKYPLTYNLFLSKFEESILKPEKNAVAIITNFQEGRLDLSNLRLVEFPDKIIPNEKKPLITNLELQGNSIKNIPKTIGQFSKLSKLNLEGNKLNSLPIELLEVGLSYLNLKNNKFSLHVQDEARGKGRVRDQLNKLLKKNLLKSITKEAKKHIAASDFKNAINTLRNLPQISDELKNSLIMLESSFNDLNAKQASLRISDKNYEIEINNLKYRLLGILSELSTK